MFSIQFATDMVYNRFLGYNHTLVTLPTFDKMIELGMIAFIDKSHGKCLGCIVSDPRVIFIQAVFAFLIKCRNNIRHKLVNQI